MSLCICSGCGLGKTYFIERWRFVCLQCQYNKFWSEHFWGVTGSHLLLQISKLSWSHVCLVLQVMANVHSATQHASPALEKTRTSVPNVQKVCIFKKAFFKNIINNVNTKNKRCNLNHERCSSRTLLEPSTNVRDKMSAGFVWRPAERRVRGVPRRVFGLRGPWALHPLPEPFHRGFVPAGRQMRPAVRQVRF